jgi:hypothetical protein
MSRDNDVKQWLVRQHFYWEKGKPRGGATHIVTTADGKCAGKLAIVDDQHEAFLRHVASDFAHTCDQCSWTIHENATRYSRVYFKLNFDEVVPREGEPMETLFLQYVASVLQTCVIEHFPTVAAALRKRNNVANERGYCVVLAAPASFARFESNEAQNEAQWRRKISLHIIFPHLYADLNQMLQLRAAAIVMLDGRWDKYAPPSGASSWDVVIDANVYTTNDAGLCMPGRSTVCDACAAKSGRVARAYVPILALDTYGESAQLRHLLDSPFDMLRLCTIRMPYQFTNDLRFRVPNNLPTYSDAPIIYSVPDSYIQANLPPPGANDRAINPGTSQSLAARESRGHKRKAASLSFDPRTGLKRGAMSKSARKDMPTGRLLQQFVSRSTTLPRCFRKFLRECSKWL